MEDNTCWQGCEKIGILVQRWWECKLVKSLWKTVWWLLKKLKIELPYDPSISLLGSHPKELKVWRLRKQKEFLNSVAFPLCKSFFLYFVSIRKYQVDLRDQGWGSQGFCKIRFWAVGLRRVAKATMQPGWWQTHGHVLLRVVASWFLTHMCTLELKDRKSLLWSPWTSFREGPWDSAESSIGKIKFFSFSVWIC